LVSSLCLVGPSFSLGNRLPLRARQRIIVGWISSGNFIQKRFWTLDGRPTGCFLLFIIIPDGRRKPCEFVLLAIKTQIIIGLEGNI